MYAFGRTAAARAIALTSRRGSKQPGGGSRRRYGVVIGIAPSASASSKRALSGTAVVWWFGWGGAVWTGARRQCFAAQSRERVAVSSPVELRGGLARVVQHAGGRCALHDGGVSAESRRASAARVGSRRNCRSPGRTAGGGSESVEMREMWWWRSRRWWAVEWISGEAMDGREDQRRR